MATSYPLTFGMSGAAIADAENAAFEREQCYLSGWPPKTCTGCGVDVAMREDEGAIVPVEGGIEGDRVWCSSCFGAAGGAG
jgi:hypothetical protein